MTRDDYYYRVLTIDGGGLKGLFPATFLAQIEDDLPLPLVSYFDLVVGTSTGGIIALGLGAGLTGKQIADFYNTHGPKVFINPQGKLGQLFRNKYDRERLKNALEGILGNKKLGESRTRLVIPSANLDTGEVYINKTSHHQRFQRDYKQSMVEVAMATASAPLYFEPHRSSDGGLLVDGGLWANNPTGMAAVEAVGVLEWPRTRVRILSLGTTSEAFDAGAARRSFAFLPTKVASIFQTMFAVQSSASIGTAQHLIGHENVIRINPTVPKGRYNFDKTDEAHSLQGLGASEARKEIPRLKKLFFDVPATEFEPYWKLETGPGTANTDS